MSHDPRGPEGGTFPLASFRTLLVALGALAGFQHSSAVFAAPEPSATYFCEPTFVAGQPGVSALTPVDPLEQSGFETATLFGKTRKVYRYSGNRDPTEEEAGLRLDMGSLATPNFYSIEMVFEFVDGDFRRVLDPTNGTGGRGLYVNENNLLQLYGDNANTIATGTTFFTLNQFHHLVVTVNAPTVTVYLDGHQEFSVTAFTAMQFGGVLGFFIDRDGEYANGRVALINVYNALTPAQVSELAADPFKICGCRTELIDPNPSLVCGTGVCTDRDMLNTENLKTVEGLAADGTTRLLLRVTVPGPGTVEFALEDEAGETAGVGTLTSPGGNENATSLSLPVEAGAAHQRSFAVLKAPDDFVRTSADWPLAARTLNLHVTFHPEPDGDAATCPAEISLRRPPLVFLHGIWADRGAWLWPLVYEDPRFVVQNEDWSDTNDRSLRLGYIHAYQGISRALRLMRLQHIAASRADVFGHSTGGLLFRKYAASKRFIRKDNFSTGDIHKLITVDTPHGGSPLANSLFSTINAPIIGPFLDTALKVYKHCASCGLIEDLRIDSPEILNMLATPVPAHAIVGKGGSDIMQEALESFLPGEIQALLDILRFFGLLPEDIFPPALQHDFAVGRLSQEGGLGTDSSRTSPFGLSAATLDLGVHITMPWETRVNDRAVALLNTPVTDSAVFAPGFPPGPSAGYLPQEMVSLARPRITPRGFLAGGIAITQPAAGTHFLPGQPLFVKVEPVGGFVPARVLITTDHDARFLAGPPFEASLAVPADSTGAITIKAFAFDAGDTFTSAEDLAVPIDVPATLVGIEVRPETVYLFSWAPPQRLTVVGHYSDGVDRDVTSASQGSVYESASPYNVTVDLEGYVSGFVLGAYTVTVTNGGYGANATVSVESVPLTLWMDDIVVGWPRVADAYGYDVVQGSLSVLSASQGDFSVATTRCVASNHPSTVFYFDGEQPPTGDGFWYLARARDLGTPRSYDESEFPTDSQVGSPDAGIAASAGACP